jgi:hypothetical protein
MNNKFNKVELKNKDTRNDINSRMQGFYGEESPESKKSNLINYKDLNSKLINNIQEEQANKPNNNNYNLDKKTFKNDINKRMNNISGDELFFKRLPLNNNIRDYNITVDTNKDEFNTRLMNYNSLASNVNPNPEDENKIFTAGFHNKFKDDTNKRLEELSPLSSNVGYPINKPKNPDFSVNLEPSGNISYNQYGNYQNVSENNNLSDNVNKLEDLNYKRHYPADTKQQFFFTNK